MATTSKERKKADELLAELQAARERTTAARKAWNDNKSAPTLARAKANIIRELEFQIAKLEAEQAEGEIEAAAADALDAADLADGDPDAKLCVPQAALAHVAQLQKAADDAREALGRARAAFASQVTNMHAAHARLALKRSASCLPSPAYVKGRDDGGLTYFEVLQQQAREPRPSAFSMSNALAQARGQLVGVKARLAHELREEEEDRKAREQVRGEREKQALRDTERSRAERTARDEKRKAQKVEDENLVARYVQ